MKFVYVVEIMQLSNLKNEFFTYDMEVIASDKFHEGDEGVKAYVQNMIDCNKGTEVEWEDMSMAFRRGEKATVQVTYNSMSTPVDEGEESREMRIRYVIRKMEINKNWM